MSRRLLVLALICGLAALGCETAHPGYVANRSVAETQEASLQDGRYLREAVAAQTDAEQEEQQRSDRNKKFLYGVLMGAGVLAVAGLLLYAMAMASLMNYH